MARILLGVTGGISAYKAVELARLAIKAGHAVRVIQTESSLRFVGSATFEGITGAPVLSSQFEPDPAGGAYPGEPRPDHDPISHLELVERCDVYCIAPASANTIAKLAAGVADNLLSAAYLACVAPVLIAPAMNSRMYEHPATRANVELLRDRGVEVLEPGVGALASRAEWGVGRLPEPPDLLAAIERLAGGTGTPLPLDGMRVLVTTGGTREPLDSVRYIGNRSSGRMGLALASEAARRGARVTVVAANVALPRSPGIEYVDVETAAELRRATLERFEDCDLLLMAAAVADFRPADPHDGKIAKQGRPDLELRLVATADVLSELAAQRRPGQTLIGFAAEHGASTGRARAKLECKALDAIVFNDISRPDIGFDSAHNEVTIVASEGERVIARAGKAEVAAAILDFSQELRTRTGVDARELPREAD